LVIVLIITAKVNIPNIYEYVIKYPGKIFINLRITF